MAIEVFNRYEKKYLLGTEAYLKLRSVLMEYMEHDPYNRNGLYSICNVYYDTADDELIRRSLDKPEYKEKLRMRAYGVPKEDGQVFVEIKKKVKGLVNKRRTALRLWDACNFLETGREPEQAEEVNQQVVREISYLIKRKKLYPKLYLAYDREAFFDKGASDLRISFDTNIRTRRYALNLSAGDEGEPLLDNDVWLMEVKAEKTIPMWLSRLLSENQLFSTSFSKYGTEYQQYLIKKEQEEQKCWTFYSTLPQIVSLPLQAR